MTVTHGSHAIHMIPLPENGNCFATWKKEDLIMQVLHSQTDRYGLRVKKMKIIRKLRVCLFLKIDYLFSVRVSNFFHNRGPCQ